MGLFFFISNKYKNSLLTAHPVLRAENRKGGSVLCGREKISSREVLKSVF